MDRPFQVLLRPQDGLAAHPASFHQLSKRILTQLAKSWAGSDWLAAKEQLFLLKLLSNCSVSGIKSPIWTR